MTSKQAFELWHNSRIQIASLLKLQLEGIKISTTLLDTLATTESLMLEEAVNGAVQEMTNSLNKIRHIAKDIVQTGNCSPNHIECLNYEILSIRGAEYIQRRCQNPTAISEEEARP